MTTETNVAEQEPHAERTRAGQVYRPNVDILETQDEVTLVADVPGANAESIEIDFEDGVLTVQAKTAPRGDENTKYLLCEYGVGDFYRTFRLSERINAAGIHAECAGGVLTVHLPKVEAVRPRKIEVTAAG